MNYLKPNSTQWLSLENLPNEQWKDIKGYEGLYQISNFGRVKSFKKRKPYIMRAHESLKHYLDSPLTMNGIEKRYRLHRLVAQAFIPNPNNLPQVNHIDGNKHNNHVSNLEWCDNGYNQRHAFANGLNSRKKLGESPKAKKICQFTKDGKLIKIWDCCVRIKLEKGWSDGFICMVCKGKYKTAYGYKWKYYEEVKHELVLQR